jgi:hypothetical protein
VVGLAVAVRAVSGGSDHQAPNDSGLQQAVAGSQSGAEVTFDATLIQNPFRSGTHEHLIVSAAGVNRLEIDNNTDLAGWVPAHRGDSIAVRGQLYIDPGPTVGVHCTHRQTSSGCPSPGWIRYQNRYYE